MTTIEAVILPEVMLWKWSEPPISWK